MTSSRALYLCDLGAKMFQNESARRVAVICVLVFLAVCFWPRKASLICPKTEPVAPGPSDLAAEQQLINQEKEEHQGEQVAPAFQKPWPLGMFLPTEALAPALLQMGQKVQSLQYQQNNTVLTTPSFGKPNDALQSLLLPLSDMPFTGRGTRASARGVTPFIPHRERGLSRSIRHRGAQMTRHGEGLLTVARRRGAGLDEPGTYLVEQMFSFLQSTAKSSGIPFAGELTGWALGSLNGALGLEKPKKPTQLDMVQA